jgi:ATP-dependent DNA ligase
VVPRGDMVDASAVKSALRPIAGGWTWGWGMAQVSRSRPAPGGIAARCALGKQDGKKLSYIGKVGTGWNRARPRISEQSSTSYQPPSRCTKPVRKPTATWVEPKLYADVEYRDITF